MILVIIDPDPLMGAESRAGYEKTTVLMADFCGSYRYNMSEYLKLTQSIGVLANLIVIARFFIHYIQHTFFRFISSRNFSHDL